MPTLDWIGKKAVVNHHRQVPFRLLQERPELSAGDPAAGNLLVQGDNLLALKALLPYYAGKVKCIYIDPPYNTGNEGWVYNDAVNSPEIRRWLGQVVGPEAQDLSRHDKWLCMMYPRLALLREFLAEDGAIFVTIDDTEHPRLRLVMDEIFGPRNMVPTVIWQKVFASKNSARTFSENHDYIVVYARDLDQWRRNLIPRNATQTAQFKNPDNDPRGPWNSVALSARNPYSEGIYLITAPSGRVVSGPPRGRYWSVSAAKFTELDADRRIWWGKRGDGIPRLKVFLSEAQEGIVPATIWPHAEAGNTQEAKKELLSILPHSELIFPTPKPIKLLRRILQIATERDSLVMDSFSGSGTTGHAVLDLNQTERGHRHFILVEMDEAICQGVTAPRLRRAVEGYTIERSGNTVPVAGLGGGFRYCTLGEPLFDEAGNIRGTVTFAELAAHVFFTETGAPVPQPVNASSPLLGAHEGKAVYLLFNGVLGDRRPAGGNVLTGDVLRHLRAFDGARVVYGEGCRLGADRLRQEGVVFRQIPYDIKVS